MVVAGCHRCFTDKPLDLGDPLTVWIVGHLRDILPIFRPMIRLACGCMFGLADWCLYFNEPWSLWLSDMGCLRIKMTILHSRDKEVSKHWILGFAKNYGEPVTMAGLEARKTDENSGVFTCPEGKDGDGTNFPCQADCGTQWGQFWHLIWNTATREISTHWTERWIE